MIISFVQWHWQRVSTQAMAVVVEFKCPFKDCLIVC